MARFRGALVDLDGTVWRGSTPVPGAEAGIRALQEAGVPIVFVTNNTGIRPETFADRLDDLGIDVAGDDLADRVVTATTATAEYLAETHPDAEVYVVGRQAVSDAIRERGLTVVEEGPADVVVAAFTRDLNYALMKRTLRAFRSDTLFVATNPDRTTPAEDGVAPGAGYVVGAVEGMTGRDPLVVGKPSTRLAEMALARLDADPEDCLIVGDRIDTDVLMGERAGMETALVLSGTSTRADAEAGEFEPDHVIESLADVENIL